MNFDPVNNFVSTFIEKWKKNIKISYFYKLLKKSQNILKIKSHRTWKYKYFMNVSSSR